MKLIRVFLSILVFAVCAVFNVRAQNPGKVITIEAKAEKIIVESPAKAAPSNFVRTDSLVMYESFFQALDLSRVKMSILIIKEKFKPLPAADSKFFPPRVNILWQRQHVYV